MGAIGDSYTAGAFSGSPCALTAALCTANSWSTGTSINSHYLRLRVFSPTINGRNYTYASSGRKMDDLVRQANLAVAQQVQYVTIMLGLNDACRESEAAMTPVATFRTQFTSGMNTLRSGLPTTRFFVTSIIDPERLRVVFKDDAAARSAWAAQQVCAAALANPLSTATADWDRRASVRQRVIDFNRQLAEVCAQYVNCRFDNNAVFNWQFTKSQFVTRDYFHPSPAGQATWPR